LLKINSNWAAEVNNEKSKTRNIILRACKRYYGKTTQKDPEMGEYSYAPGLYPVYYLFLADKIS
jgi:hypothetical protein